VPHHCLLLAALLKQKPRHGGLHQAVLVPVGVGANEKSSAANRNPLAAVPRGFRSSRAGGGWRSSRQPVRRRLQSV
jgi:hypothetical protein